MTAKEMQRRSAKCRRWRKRAGQKPAAKPKRAARLPNAKLLRRGGLGTWIAIAGEIYDTLRAETKRHCR